MRENPLAIALAAVFLLAFASCSKPTDGPPMSTARQDESLELTTEEKESEERDRRIMEVARELNAGDQTPINEIFPDAVEVHESNELRLFAALGDTGKVKLALQKGADINMKSEDGETPLHAAAANGHLEVVQLLLNHGADPIAKMTSGETPLDVAQQFGYREIVEFLQSKQQ